MTVLGALQAANPWWGDPSARPNRVRSLRARRELARLEGALGTAQGSLRAQLILGPRNVGKTVLLFQLVQRVLDGGVHPSGVVYFDFSDDRLTDVPSVREVIELSEQCRQHDPGGGASFFFLDELHLAPRWDRWLKRAVDERLGHIVGTGSSQAEFRRGIEESGLGRWDEIALETVDYRDFLALQAAPEESIEKVALRLARPFERFVTLGGYPGPLRDELDSGASIELARKRLRVDAAERAIRGDLSRHGVDTDAVRRLFVHLVHHSGSELSVENTSRDLGTSINTLHRHLELLKGTGLIAVLRRSGKTDLRGVSRPKVSLKGKRKIFAADHGLISAFSLLEEPSMDGKSRGDIFEGLVFHQLRQLVGEEWPYQLSYFRERDDREIDFVVNDGNRTLGIEVTASVDPKRKVASLLRAASPLGLNRLIVIHGGVQDERIDVQGSKVTLLPLLKWIREPQALMEDTA